MMLALMGAQIKSGTETDLTIVGGGGGGGRGKRGGHMKPI
jgi:hypothetical protein